MRISGNEPSSVILRQTKWFPKQKKIDPKVPKQAGAKRDGVKNPQNHNFNQSLLMREEGRDLTHSYDKSPYTHRKIQKAA